MTKPLGKLELEVMKIIWEYRRATVRQIWEKLYPKKKLAYTTVATVVKNIEEKGFVTHEKQSRTYVYSPVVEQADVSRNLVRDLVDRLFDGSPAKMVTALVQSNDLNAEDLEHIKRSVNQQTSEANP